MHFFHADCESLGATGPRSGAGQDRNGKESHLRLYLKPTLGHVSLDRVRGEVVDRLFAKLRKDDWATSQECPRDASTHSGVGGGVGVIDAVPHLPRAKI
jgi:hypothetical protein